MEPTQDQVDAALPGLMDGLENAQEGQPAPAPNLDLSTLFGNAAYEGREERTSPTIETPPAPQPTPAAAPQPTSDDAQRRIEELERRHAELTESQERRRHDEAIQQAEYQEAVNRQNFYQEATRRAQAAATLPEVNPDEILGDPARFRQHNQNLVNAAVSATLQALQPAIHEHREQSARTAALLQRSQNVAMEGAVERIKKDYGFDVSAQEQAQLRARLKSLGGEGELLLADPGAVVNAFVLDRVARRQPLQARQPAPPPASPTHGSRRTTSGNVPLSSLPPAARGVLANLGIRSGDITQDEVAELGLGSLFR